MAPPKSRKTTKVLGEKTDRKIVRRARSFEKFPRGRDIERLIQELQAHQIELQLQNEELRKAQTEIEESRRKYVDLYDSAPVGYFTFNRKGKLLEVNKTGADLLGIGKYPLTNLFFSYFVDPEYQNVFLQHREKVFRNPGMQTCEIKLKKKGGASFYAQMESIAVNDSEGELNRVRSIITDVSVRKEAEKALRESEMRCRELSSRLLEVQEVERRRVALEIHDGVYQNFSTLRFRIEGVLKQLDKHKIDGARRILENLLPYIQESIRECGRIQLNLRPSLLDDLGLLATLNWFFREFQKNYPNIRVEKQVNLEEKEISDVVKINGFRILQESLHNVAKHSNANLVRFSLLKMRGAIHLAIKDNGQGFDTGQFPIGEAWRHGLGLASMRERAEFSGGSFCVETSKGKGTSIYVTWPLTPP